MASGRTVSVYGIKRLWPQRDLGAQPLIGVQGLKLRILCGLRAVSIMMRSFV